MADDLVRAESDRSWPVQGCLYRDEQLGINHAAMSYGHIGGELITLASMLRIPVCMHNPEERIFRPSAWTAFGGLEPVSADYRACTVLCTNRRQIT